MTVGRRDFAGRQAGRLAAVAATAGFLSDARRADRADPAKLEACAQENCFQPNEQRAPEYVPARRTLRDWDNAAQGFDRLG